MTKDIFDAFQKLRKGIPAANNAEEKLFSEALVNIGEIIVTELRLIRLALEIEAATAVELNEARKTAELETNVQ